MIAEEDVRTVLRRVKDPELNLNIVDLGLVYTIEVTEGKDVHVEMTLTSPGCPVAGEMPMWVENAVAAVPGVGQASVKLTFDPPWDKDRMSEAAKLQLGFF